MRTPSRRLKSLLVMGALAIAAAVGYLYFAVARPTGDGPAGPSIGGEAFESPWTTRAVRVVGLGDSITAGLGSNTPERSFFNRIVASPADDWPDMQGKSLSNALPNLRSENLAISGSDSLTHIGVIAERLEESPPEEFGLVLMTSGGNDLIHSYGRRPPREGAMYGATLSEAEPWIGSFGIRLRKMFDLIESKFPGGCEIYIADIYDPTDGVGDAPSIYLPDWPDGLAILARYNAVIRECADERPHIHLVPLRETFLGHGSHCRQFWRAHYDSSDPTYWFYTNIEDPNDRGHDAIRRIFLQTIVEASKLRDEAEPELP